MENEFMENSTKCREKLFSKEETQGRKNRMIQRIRRLFCVSTFAICAASGLGCDNGNENKLGPEKKLKFMKELDLEMDEQLTEIIKNAHETNDSSDMPDSK